MNSALASFDANMVRAREMIHLYNQISQQPPGGVDPTDLLRAALVMGASALDHFVHEVTRIGMLQVPTGARVATPAFEAFSIPLDRVRVALSTPGALSWLEQTVREAHGWQTFQRPDKIAEAFRLISSAKLWESVATLLGSTAASVKAQLNAVVDRRNKIAHEADIDPSFPNQRWPISDAMTTDALAFIDRVVRAIYGLL